MGFYGNITNTTRTQFSFDAVYSSRYEMDTATADDHVYIGRYVLVEYDTKNGGLDKFQSVYKATDEKLTSSFVFCISPEVKIPGSDNAGTVIQLRKSDSSKNDKVSVDKGTIIRVPGSDNKDKIHYNQMYDKNDVYPTEYWICTGETTGYIRVETKDETTNSVKVTTEPFPMAAWENIGLSSSTNFSLNYNQDKLYYGVSRGYDSTVWQKVLQDGYEKYVMVAELNTVVPTFDLSADAPTQIPLIPHFDTNSTNVYYNLHWQPNWGFRVKTAHRLQTPQLSATGEVLSDTVSTSSDAVEYPSDETVVWQRDIYDNISNSSKRTYARAIDKTINWIDAKYADSTTEGVRPELPAAIYYNKDGFNPASVSKSWDHTYANQPAVNTAPRRTKDDPAVNLTEGNNFISDEISIKPTGLSGQKYQNHNKTEQSFVDTQEISIMLPSIGDAISDVWDLVYGGRSTNEQIKDTQKRNMDIEWYDARSVQDRAGLRLVSDGFSYQKNVTDDKGNVTQDLMVYPKDSYNTANVNTIAGCINSVHDLMGMIIEPYSTRDDMIAGDKTNTDDIIYYDANEQKFYRKGVSYKYTAAAEDIYTFDPISLSRTEYKPGLFYVEDSSGNYIESSKDYSSSTQYYVRKINKGGEYKLVSNLRDYTEDYNNGTYYYYKKPLGNSKYDYIVNPTYYHDKTYYRADTESIDATRQDLGTEFVTGKYYTLQDSVLTLDKDNYNAGKTYYDIKEIFSLSDINASPPYVDLYLPGIFYYRAWSRDTYEQLSYVDELKNETLYALEGTDTYVLIQNNSTLRVGDTCYRKQHYKGDPYTEKNLNKNDFEYLVDNTENGVGSSRKKENGVDFVFKSLITHFMVEPQDSEVEIYTPVYTYVQVFFDKDSGYTYSAGNYYVENKETGEFEISYDAVPDKNKAYFEQQVKYIFTGQGGTINEKNPLILYPYAKTEDINYIDKDGKQQIFKKELIASHPWYLKEKVTTYDNNGNPIVDIKYTEVTSTSIRNQLIQYYTKGIGKRDSLQYFKLESSKIQKFYAPNTYYYKVGKDKDPVYKNSYILETNKKKVIPDSSSTDYALAHLLIDDGLFKKVESSTTFYYPNYYYYKDVDGEYVLGTESTKKKDFKYYIQNGVRYYVIEDTSGVIPYGQMWNPNIKNVPPSITLATREVGYEYYELREFARKLNTIHGMILKVNQMLDEGNAGSRDMNTVQGALNSLKDWIAHLGTLDSQEIMMVDSYGSIQTAPVICDNQVEKNTIDFTSENNFAAGTKSDAQDIVSDVFPIAESVGSTQWKNQWLTVNVDGKPTNPRITVRHNYQPVKNQTTSLDINGNGDNFVLTTPLIDPRGHVVGKNDETITLPYGFKTIVTNGRLIENQVKENASSDPATSNIVAKNTQDALNINSGNKWVRIDTNASSKSLTISHDVHNITEDQKDTNLNDENGTDTFTVQDTEYDEAGHVKSNISHKFTLPYSFKFISINDKAGNNIKSTIIANKTQDTLRINSDDIWTKITADDSNNTLTINHGVKNKASIDKNNNTQNLSSETSITSFKVTTYTFDETNHFSGGEEQTINMPGSYGKIAADTGTATGASATYDTLTLSGDSWLQTAVTQDKVTFTHKEPLKTGNTTTNIQENKNLSLGGTFTIPTVSYDARGHISSNSTYTLTLPSLEVTGTKAAGDNILVDLAYNKNGTAITRTYDRVGNLQLNGYTTPTIGGNVSNTDSLNTAIGKLQFNIAKEITDRDNAIKNLEFKDAAIDGQYVDSVSETNGVISVTRKDFNPQVSIKDLDTTPNFNLEIGGITAKADLPIASATEFGLIKTSDSYEAVENETVLEGLAASSKALRDLAQNSCLKDEAFTYSKTIRENTESGWVLKQEDIVLTIQELFNRVSLLEKAILNSNQYATIEEIELVEGGNVLNE